MRPPIVIENARKNSVAVQRIRINRQQGEQLKRIEVRDGKDAGLRYLLSILKLK